MAEETNPFLEIEKRRKQSEAQGPTTPVEPNPFREQQREEANPPQQTTANEVIGDQLADTISLGYLDKIRGPLAGFVNRANELGGRPSTDRLPEQTAEQVTEQLKTGKAEHPIAAAVGKGAGRGIQALATAPLLPFTGPVLAGAATSAIPAAAENAIAYGRGRKTGGEALADTGLETLLGAAGGKAAQSISRATQPTAQIARGLPAVEATAARPMPSPVSAAWDEATSLKGTLRALGLGTGGAYGTGTGGLLAAAAPSAIASGVQMGRNMNTAFAKEALGMLEANPALATQLVGNRTALDRFLQALIAGGAAPTAEALTP